MDVHFLGDDPIRTAVVDALGDVDVSVVDATVSDLEEARFAVVADVAGAETFPRANVAARTGETPWVALEVGGVGGQPFEAVDAAVSGFAPGQGCFQCLTSRVASASGAGTEKASADPSGVRFAGAVAGYEVATLLSGGSDAIVGSVLEIPWRRRPLWPVPGCDCGDERRTVLDLGDDAGASLSVATERAEAAVDDRVGLVTEIGEIASFPAPYYLAEVADTKPFSDAIAPRQAAGVDDDWNAAFVKAIGEGLERYCAGVYTDGDLEYTSLSTLESAISPADLVRPDDAPELEETEEAPWVLGENLHTGESVYLPASAVHFPPPGTRYVPAITTGLGLGTATIDALLSGVTEVIERDAAMLSWYSTDEPVALSVEDEQFQVLEKRARSEGLSVTSLLVTQDVDVPVVAVALHRTSTWPKFAVGSGASLDPVHAARSALAEALQNWMELRSIGKDDAEGTSAAIGEYASFPDAAREFVDAETTVPIDRIGLDDIPSGRDRLEHVLSALDDAGLAAYATRLTTRDVEAIGFETVRVIVPGAQPLFTDEPFFGERARTVPESLGFEARVDGPFHPYP